MKLVTKALLAASAAILTTPAMAATQVVVDGILTGATGVTVGTKTYNVSFADGTCANAFGTCAMSSFAFSTSADALAASNALLDQVFLDTNLGNFDSNPTLTFGCSAPGVCQSYIPFAANTNGSFSAAAPINRSSTSIVSDSTRTNISFLDVFNLADTTSSNFAIFTLVVDVPMVVDPPVVVPPVVVVPTPAAAVPEPSTWAMMLVGFGLVGGAARYRRRSVKVSLA